MKLSGYYLEKTGNSHLWFRVKGSIIRIGYSILGNWSSDVEKKQCLKLTDAGNGIVLNLTSLPAGTKRQIELDYCEAAYVLHALEELRTTSPNTFNKTFRVTK